MSTSPPPPDFDNNHSPEAIRKGEEFGHHLAEKHRLDEERFDSVPGVRGERLGPSQQVLSLRERYVLFLEERKDSLSPQERNLLLLARQQAKAGQHEEIRADVANLPDASNLHYHVYAP